MHSAHCGLQRALRESQVTWVRPNDRLKLAARLG